MNKLPKEILVKQARVLELKKGAIRRRNMALSEPNMKYKKERYEFIELCIIYRVPYETIGNLIGVSKTRIYQIQRYGLTGEVSPQHRKDILKRDLNMCFICRKSGKNNIINIHHINNPKDSSPKNLISLCTECHIKLDAIKRQSDKNLTKV